MEDSTITKKKKLAQLDEEYSIRSYGLEALIIFMLIIMMLLYFSNRFFSVIPAGHKGVYFSTLFGGTELNKYYDEGFHLVFPIDYIYIYNTRIQEQHDSILALTDDGLEIILDVSFRYFPDPHNLGRIHKEIGPDYLNTILLPRVAAITRDVISHFDVEHLYSNRDTIQEIITQISQYQITDNYPLNITDVVIRSIILPKTVMEAINGKLVYEQEMLEYSYRLKLEEQEALRKEIEAKGIRIFSDTSNLDILKWEGINATKELAKSPNSKIVVIGTDSGDLPIILGGSN